ncbi:prolipoprotein diacylglyceryl transferase [Candidatus Gromoviella agglomerans]|uniref:prolipoprotein diacylglyceryl transferase n=1 Tax=Candidatus Gromoviella agglomerans TaxID=2806609 RepID=UPI001E5BE338|nr:prolipoprotein diacylglyceryl transferase [Candidatus Gromoviella agglomerans]UFX98325.1 Prolipoprotein diacylglyceryl transferase domain protein [Candidatus Gromoviella agglomerans]
MLDPVALYVFGFPIYWYGVLYSASVLLVGRFSVTYACVFGLDRILLAEIFNFSLISMIVCARIFDVLVYNFDEFLSNPWSIFSIRSGGLSFHGGLIGVIVCLWRLSITRKFSFFQIADCFAFWSPIGLFLVRLGNFINSELIGIKLAPPFLYGVDFGDGFIRHPSQLYEAFLEGFALFGVLYLMMVLKNFDTHNSHYFNRISKFNVIKKYKTSFDCLVLNKRFFDIFMKIWWNFIPILLSILILGAMYCILVGSYVLFLFNIFLILIYLCTNFFVMYFLRLSYILRNGAIFSTFLLSYGIFRVFCESFKEPEIVVCLIPIGQIFCIFMIFFGFLMNFLKFIEVVREKNNLKN